MLLTLGLACFDYLSSPIGPAKGASLVRRFDVVALGTRHQGGNSQLEVAASFPLTCLSVFSFGQCHDLVYSSLCLPFASRLEATLGAEPRVSHVE